MSGVLTFDEATDLHQQEPGRFVVGLDAAWSGNAGPSGGYLAAILLRALAACVDDPRHAPRTLSCQFLSSPAIAPVQVDVRVQKAGRRASFLGATLRQEGRVCAVASATFASSIPSGAAYCDLRLPSVTLADDVPPETMRAGDPPVLAMLDVRPVFATGLGSGEANRAAWMRLRSDRCCDPLLQCLLGDALLPSPVERVGRLLLAPTIDYTVYFWSAAGESLRAGRHVFVHMSSSCAREGFFEEDGLIFSPDGVLLTMTRQLALLQ